jgi:hypothetical protein
MLKIKTYFRTFVFCAVGLALQSCTIHEYWFMVANTQVGNVCIDDLQLASTDPYAQSVSQVIYSKYGQSSGITSVYSSEDIQTYGTCETFTLDNGTKANLIISYDDYRQIERDYINSRPK